MKIDHVLSLAIAAMAGDRERCRTAITAMVANERLIGRHVSAGCLERALNQRPIGNTGSAATKPGANKDDDNKLIRLETTDAQQTLLLAPEAQATLQPFMDEWQHAELLARHNIQPSNRLLLSGPPGNGKTSLSRAIAQQLNRPLYLFRAPAVIERGLGDTEKNVERAIQAANDAGPCVLLIDEIDAIGMRRGSSSNIDSAKDAMNRAVNVLLMSLDRMSPDVLLVGTTNRPDMLDDALLSRFQHQMVMPPPTTEQLAQLFRNEASRTNSMADIDADAVGEQLDGLSFREAASAIRRMAIQSIIQRHAGSTA